MLRLVDKTDNNLEEELETDFIYQKYKQAYEDYYMDLADRMTNEELHD